MVFMLPVNMVDLHLGSLVTHGETCPQLLHPELDSSCPTSNFHFFFTASLGLGQPALTRGTIDQLKPQVRVLVENSPFNTHAPIPLPPGLPYLYTHVCAQSTLTYTQSLSLSPSPPPRQPFLSYSAQAASSSQPPPPPSLSHPDPETTTHLPRPLPLQPPPPAPPRTPPPTPPQTTPPPPALVPLPAPRAFPPGAITHSTTEAPSRPSQPSPHR